MNSKLNTKENIQPLDLADHQPRNKICDEESRQIAILFEYKMLQMYGSLLGLYAIPNMDNYKIWNCIIFVRKGFFKDGKFKFDVTFSHQFPQKPPTIVFKSSVFHPLVRQDGLVDIGSMMTEEWEYENQNMLYNLFSSLQKMFYDKSKLEIRYSFNSDAAKMLSLKPHTFIQRAFQSVQLSKQNLYNNEPGTSLIIKKYENGQLEPYKQKLQSLCSQNRAPQEKKKQFLNFVLNDTQ